MTRFAAIVVVILVTHVASAAAAAPNDRCVFDGDFVGYADLGPVAGVDFVTPIFEAVQAHDCDLSGARVAMPDPVGDRWIDGTPWFDDGERYRVTVEQGGTVGTHRVRGYERIAPLSPVASALERFPPDLAARKVGLLDPPCSRLAWRDDAFPIAIEVHRPREHELVDGADIEAIRAAVESWNALPCTIASLVVDVLYTERTPLEPDGRNTIEFTDADSDLRALFEELEGEVLGFTCYVCDEDGYFIEADVRFDGAQNLWSTECSTESHDIFGAVLHELGHVLGMPHLEDHPAAVMFPVTSARRLLDVREPAAPDAAWLCDAYPCPGALDCSGQFDERVDCPVGLGLCEECDTSEDCGAESDRCLLDTATDRRFCARACSSSFPCPTGYSCVSVGSGQRQCVPDGEGCRDLRQVVGCACEHDDACGLELDRCLEGGVCGAYCEGGIGCPAGSRCEMTRDDDGLPTGRQCVPDSDSPPVCGVPSKERGCGCGMGRTQGRGGSLGWVVAALVFAVGARRRQSGWRS